MKNIYHLMSILFTLYLAGSLVGCAPNIDTPDTHLGKLRVDAYMAYGDGVGAGFNNTDIFDPQSPRGLFANGQEKSFPVLLAKQFNLAAKEIKFAVDVLEGNGSGYFQLEEVLVSRCEEDQIQAIMKELEPSDNWMAPSGHGPGNNLSIPKLTVSDIENPNINNPFLRRIQTDSSQSYLEIIQSHPATFFTLYAGSRDLLNYALRGGNDPNYPLVSVEDFESNYLKILEAIFYVPSTATRGVVGRIPDLTEFPYFTTVDVMWKEEANCFAQAKPVYIETRNGEIRIAQESDRILLPAAYKLGKDPIQGVPFGLGESHPVPQDLVLDTEEVTELKLHISELNERIDVQVYVFNNRFEQDRIAVAPIDQLINSLSTGLIEDGLDINSSYLAGGFFSIDGIYLTERGNAMVANEFIKTINEHPSFGALIPPLHIIDYSGVVYP